MRTGRSVTVPPFGAVQLEKQIHSGRMFDVYDISIGDLRMCVKTSASHGQTANEPAAFVSRFSGVGTSLWIGSTQASQTHEASVFVDDIGVRTAMLCAEAEAIRASRGAWNHAVVALTTWDGAAAPLEEPGSGIESAIDASRFQVALVLPAHAGQTLAAQSLEVRRRLIPRMLPALWDALAAAPHRDLTPDNILIAPDHHSFVLIDPGVVLWSTLTPAQRAGDDQVDTVLLTTTTAAYYPLLPPTYRAPMGLPAQPDLGAHLDWLERLTASGADATTSFLPDVGQHSAHVHATRPSEADMLAIGIMYYEALTGTNPCADRSDLFPAWVGSFGETQLGQLARYRHIRTNLRNLFVQPGVVASDVSPAEDRLAVALLNLAVTSREELVALAASTT